jgi:glucokinase
MEKYVVGVDIGGTSVKNGLFDVRGNLLAKWEIPTKKENSGAGILQDVAAAIRQELEGRSISMEQLAGVGVGVPGPVQEDGSVTLCPNLGWRDYNPCQVLSALLDGVFVSAGNDANVAALGESFKGAAEGEDNVVMLTLGTGVGGGVIVNGKIVTGVHGAGGELGHIVVNPEEELACNCGNHGCLEQYASATGVVRTAKRLLAASDEDSTLRGVEELTAKQVFDEAKAGDALAAKAVDTLCMYLGLACSYCALTTDPDAFVIGGGVSKAGEILTDGISTYFERFAHIIPKKPAFKLATLGNDAGIYGAAKLVL